MKELSQKESDDLNKRIIEACKKETHVSKLSSNT